MGCERGWGARCATHTHQAVRCAGVMVCAGLRVKMCYTHAHQVGFGEGPGLMCGLKHVLMPGDERFGGQDACIADVGMWDNYL